MVAVHALVAEVLADFVHTFEAAHDQSLQVKLGGDAHIHVLIEGIEMGDKRPGRGTTGDDLQRRGFHFGITGLVKHTAHGADDRGTLQECILHAIVHHEVYVALAIAKLRVVELIIGHAVLIFHDGQGFQRFREQGQFLGMNTDLARLCAENETTNTDEVTDIEQLLEHRIVQFLVLFGADVIAGDIHLDAPFRVLQLHKRCLAHDAAAHHSSCDAHLTRLVLVLERGDDVRTERIGGELGCGIGVDAHCPKLLQTLSSAYLLLTKL